jgi:hypothetical protein
MPLLFRCSAAVIPLFFAERQQRETRVFQLVTGEFGDTARNSKNSVTRKNTAGGAQDSLAANRLQMQPDEETGGLR